MDLVPILARWLHFLAGVMWIGQTYLFNWMERRLTPASGPLRAVAAAPTRRKISLARSSPTLRVKTENPAKA